jgi:hypothetical protein
MKSVKLFFTKEVFCRIVKHFITINVPLILKVRDFMFFRREKQIISQFEGFF